MSKPSLPPVQFNKRETQIKQVALGAWDLLHRTVNFCFNIYRYISHLFGSPLDESHGALPLVTVVIAEQYMKNFISSTLICAALAVTKTVQDFHHAIFRATGGATKLTNTFPGKAP